MMYEFITKEPTKHNHVPYKSKVDAKKAANVIKDRAAFQTDATHQIVATVSIGLSHVISAQLPADNVTKQIFRRVQHDSQASFPNPGSLNVLNLPEYKAIVRRENSLHHDSKAGDKRILIFLI
ncbi:unnamed protein product [Schistosoma rodhaini]|uniref:Uncharacterized protein n=1 Tax=Schistosoma rodhaini TaxID=6188 RepID=A0AA85FNG1_9TREM|nr:unnamed protein product [Schistosoma rodhaini]